MPNQLKTQNINLDVDTQLNNASSSLVAFDNSNHESNLVNHAVKATPNKTYPVWSVWKKRPCVKVWEAVALSKNINPKYLAKVKESDPKRYFGYTTRLKTTRYWLDIEIKIQDHPENGNTGKEKMILLTDFIICAQANNMKIAPELMEITKEAIQKTKVNNNLSNVKSSRSSITIDNRNEELNKLATKTGQELHAKHKTKKITKLMVAKEIRKIDDWKDMEEATIIRIIKVSW